MCRTHWSLAASSAIRLSNASAGGCSIYEDRPLTCRRYDCRLFAAAGVTAGGDEKAEVTRRVARWSFDFASEGDRAARDAIRAAAAFLGGHADLFDRGVTTRCGQPP